MPTINKSQNSGIHNDTAGIGRAGANFAQDVQGAASQLRDHFEGAPRLGGMVANDPFLFANIKHGLQKTGVVALKEGVLAALPLRHLPKISELIKKSEDPLYFVIQLGDGGEIAGASSYGDRGEWLLALKEQVAGQLSPYLQLSVADKASQLELISRITQINHTGL